MITTTTINSETVTHEANMSWEQIRSVEEALAELDKEISKWPGLEDAILEIMSRRRGISVTPIQMARAIGANRRTVGSAMSHLVEEGKLIIEGRGRYSYAANP
jgi:DNA-binding transcriptional ArsR family regulator